MKKSATILFVAFQVLATTYAWAGSCAGLTANTGAEKFLSCIKELEHRINKISKNSQSAIGPTGLQGPRGEPSQKGKDGRPGSDATSPSAAVVAFERTSCPEGWEAYAKAFGRFVRGVDPTGGIDPDGQRSPGSHQDDMFESHSHVYHGGGSPPVYTGGVQWGGTNVNSSPNTKQTGGNETRPKNVALLYCIKR